MRRQSYSFDLSTLDNNHSTKANIIKLNDCFWVLSFILWNILAQIIFIYEFQLESNLAVLVCFSYLFYLLNKFEEKDIYDKDKVEILKKIINYCFYALAASIILSALSICIYHSLFVKFDSKQLLERYFTIIIFYFVIIRIICCYIFKKYIKDKFPFYKENDNRE